VILVPNGSLSDAERARLDGFPARVVPAGIETHFAPSRADRRQIPQTASPANRLGFTLERMPEQRRERPKKNARGPSISSPVVALQRALAGTTGENSAAQRIQSAWAAESANNL
jgi:hypothetical protein